MKGLFAKVPGTSRVRRSESDPTLFGDRVSGAALLPSNEDAPHCLLPDSKTAAGTVALQVER